MAREGLGSQTCPQRASGIARYAPQPPGSSRVSGTHARSLARPPRTVARPGSCSCCCQLVPVPVALAVAPLHSYTANYLAPTSATPTPTPTPTSHNTYKQLLRLLFLCLSRLRSPSPPTARLSPCCPPSAASRSVFVDRSFCVSAPAFLAWPGDDLDNQLLQHCDLPAQSSYNHLIPPPPPTPLSYRSILHLSSSRLTPDLRRHKRHWLPPRVP